MDALREIAVNAVVHRDYTAPGDSIVKVFDDRIEFYNPGGLPTGLTVPILLSGTYVSQPRNRLIAEMFKEAGIIEKFGSGIKRIVEACRRHGSKRPRFAEIAGGFLVTIYPARYPETPQKTPQKISLSERILRIIKSNPAATRADIARELAIKPETVKEYLKKLKKLDKIERQGSDRSGLWKIKTSKRWKYRFRRSSSPFGSTDNRSTDTRNPAVRFPGFRFSDIRSNEPPLFYHEPHPPHEHDNPYAADDAFKWRTPRYNTQPSQPEMTRQKIERFISGFSIEGFLEDDRTIDAVIRNLEIMGEAASRLAVWRVKNSPPFLIPSQKRSAFKSWRKTGTTKAIV
jgi:DNA-binding CsgD family transcriptional regulator